MKFKINHIEYETEETNIKLIEFLKNNKLSFINNNLLKVEIENNKIEIKGHANYDDYGKDIVCASVSSIVITTINAIIEFDPESIYYEDLNNRILIEKLKDDDITNKLISNMIELLEELEKSYKDNIKIIRR